MTTAKDAINEALAKFFSTFEETVDSLIAEAKTEHPGHPSWQSYVVDALAEAGTAYLFGRDLRDETIRKLDKVGIFQPGIRDALGCSIGTVNNVIHRGRR